MRCPTCGQPVETGLDAEQLYNILANGQPHRNVYRAQNGAWYVTHGGGKTTAGAVQWLVDGGRIHSVYNDLPNEVYHVGKTINTAATLAYREGRKRKDWKTIFVGE